VATGVATNPSADPAKNNEAGVRSFQLRTPASLFSIFLGALLKPRVET
jgi:hypothetical protein